MHCKELPGASNWSDVDVLATYPKTDLTSATSHFMTVTQGHLEIANGNNLAEVNYDGSYTNESLNVLPTDVINTLIEAQTNVTLLGTFKSNQAHRGTMFKWDANFNAGVAVVDTWSDKKTLPTQGINAIVNGEITVIQAGTLGGLYYLTSDFVNSVPLLQLPNGGKVNPYGVDNYEGLALFGVFGASAEYITATNSLPANGIYSYGRIKKNASMVLNLEYAIDADEIGAILVVGSDILVSYSKSGVNQAARVDTTTKADATIISLDIIPPSDYPDQKALWRMVEIQCDSLPSGTKVEVWTRGDKTGDFVQAQLEGGATQLVSGASNMGVFQCETSAEILEVLVKLIHSGNTTPDVSKLIVYYD